MKKGWRIISFGELGRVFNGNSISEVEKKAHFEGLEDGVPYIGTKDVSFEHEVTYESGVKIPDDKRDSFKLAPANTVLICAEGGSAGRKIAHTDREIYFGNKLFAVCPSPPISSRLIFYYCLSDDFAKKFKGSMAGLIGGVSINKFKELSVPVPPLAEQQRIVGLLDEALEGLAIAKANAEQNLQNARALFESHLQSVFTQRGPGWVEKRISDLSDYITVGFVGTMAHLFVDEGIPLLRGQNIRAHGIDFTKLKFISKETHAKWKKSALRPGDVAIVRVGYPGTAAVVPEGSLELNAASLVIVRPNQQRLDSYFLAHALNSEWGKCAVKARLVGAAQQVFNTRTAADLQIPLPSLAEQKVLVKRFDALAEETQRLATLYTRKLMVLEELKKSLLHQAFSGNL